MAEGDVQNFQSVGSGYNSSAFQAAGVVQTRLDTMSVIRQFETYLKGREVALVEDLNSPNGVKEVVVWEGHSIVNELGFQAIMQFMNLLINAQTVQGNWLSDDEYNEFLYRTRKELTTDLMINRPRYGIDTRDFPGLMSRVMRIIEAFMTRPIHNGERNSYAATFKTMESVHSSPQKQGSMWSSLNLFGGK